MSTVGERLRIALEKAGKNPRELDAAISAEAKRQRLVGYGYATIYRALKGDATLSVPVVDLIAAELGVSPLWLRQGRGPRTVAEVVLQPHDATHGHTADNVQAEHLATLVPDTEATPERRGAVRLTAMLRYDLDAALSMAVGKWHAVQRQKPTEESRHEVAAMIERSVLCSFDALGVEPQPAEVLRSLAELIGRLDRQLDEMFGPA